MILDREEMRSWLVAKEPDEVVGKAYDADGCPLANFIGNGYSVVPWHFGTNVWVALPDGEDLNSRAESFVQLPKWASSLASKVDQFKSEQVNKKLTAKEVLTLLDGIDA